MTEIKMKKGSAMVSWLISIIVLIIGFGILLIFYFNFIDDRTLLDRELCHESVVYRATLPNIRSVQEMIPLKCATQKICITTGLLFGGKCSDFSGEKGIKTIKVKTVEQIEKVYAQEMLDCWSMMGEGKVSVFSPSFVAGRYGFGETYPTCLICSRIALDKESLEKAGIPVENMDVYEYMTTHKVPGKEITYTEYFSGEQGNAYVVPEQEYNNTSLKVNIEATNSIKGSGTIDFEKPESFSNLDAYGQSGIVFMQISAPSQSGSIQNIGQDLLGATVGSYFLGVGRPVGWVVRGGAQACKAVPLVCAAAVILGVAVQQKNVAQMRSKVAGYCGEVSVGSEARKGCSIVKTVAYDAEELASFCSVIEGMG